MYLNTYTSEKLMLQRQVEIEEHLCPAWMYNENKSRSISNLFIILRNKKKVVVSRIGEACCANNCCAVKA